MSSDKKLQYEQFILTINKSIQEYEDQIQQLTAQLSNNINSNQYITLAIVTFQLRIISLYFQQDDEYMLLFGNHNKVLLEHSRKIYGELIVLLKKFFSIQVTTEFSKTEDYVTQLTHLGPQRLLNLISQLEYLCIQLKQKYSPTSKYIISVASIYSDICGFALNIIDFPKYINITRSLSHPNYAITKELLDLIETMLEKSGMLFIDAYQASENDKEQVRKALHLLNALETYLRITGRKDSLAQLERKKQSWGRYLS